jgi:hypothetical protein
MIKSRKLQLVGYVARMGENGDAYRGLVGKPEKSPLGDVDLDGRKMLKWILETWYGAWAGSTGLGIKVTGCCECGDEPSGYIKCWEFSDYLKTC